MPKLKSAKKHQITSAKAYVRNRAIRSRMRTALKKVRQAPDKASAETALQAAVSIIDRTNNKGIIHKNAAARYKSRLNRLVQTIA
ncbi:MAG: 30S ribosomal protein S20 [Gemmatimonadetes bacterium]|nr:30S ribosomal protein S20 [Gemmatimonadota bacterium]